MSTSTSTRRPGYDGGRMDLLAGIFVGGRARRMGGIAKGLLASPDGQPIVVRTRRLLEEIGAECVLVGAHPAYEQVGLEVLPDDPAAEGPLAGLLALLDRARSARWAIAIACDMPFIDRTLVQRLVDAPPAPIVAPRRRAVDRGRDVWEPLFARYDPAVLEIARAYANGGGKKLQLLLDAAGAQPVELVPEDEGLLADWDALPLGSGHDSKGE